MNAARLLMITAFVTLLAMATAATRPYALIAVGAPLSLPALDCRRPCEIVRPASPGSIALTTSYRCTELTATPSTTRFNPP